MRPGEIRKKLKSLPPKVREKIREEVESLLADAFYWDTQPGGIIYSEALLREAEELIKKHSK